MMSIERMTSLQNFADWLVPDDFSMELILKQSFPLSSNVAQIQLISKSWRRLNLFCLQKPFWQIFQLVTSTSKMPVRLLTLSLTHIDIFQFTTMMLHIKKGSGEERLRWEDGTKLNEGEKKMKIISIRLLTFFFFFTGCVTIIIILLL